MHLPGLASAPPTTVLFAESILRHGGDIAAVAALLAAEGEIIFRPGRVVMQDYAGLPALLDLAASRNLAAAQGRDPAHVQPACPVDLVVDHSIRATATGPGAALKNLMEEHATNAERFSFLRWAEANIQGPPRGATRQRYRSPGQPGVTRPTGARPGRVDVSRYADRDRRPTVSGPKLPHHQHGQSGCHGGPQARGPATHSRTGYAVAHGSRHRSPRARWQSTVIRMRWVCSPRYRRLGSGWPGACCPRLLPQACVKQK